MSTATQPQRTTTPAPAPRILVAAVPVCDGCRATASTGGWHLGDDGIQLCRDCWHDCGQDPADHGSRP